MIEGGADGENLLGQSVGNHHVVSKIGHGGMGAVYLAEHAVLGRKAAIKVLLPEFSRNPGLVARFLNEARATAQLRHPAFVEIFDSGTLPDGSAYLIMEFLEGEDLGQRLRRVGPMPLGDCLFIARAVADGAGFAHRHHIVHRDLKPDNVFLTAAPEGAGANQLSVKVLDFGIAKLAEPAGRGTASRTGTGVLLGTPLYMSPEQCRGAGQVDFRSDIYSLGCIIYATLVGTPPFFLEGFGEIIAAHLSQAPAPVSRARPDVPPAAEAFIMSLLAKAPEHRPADMSQIIAEIDRLRGALNLSVGLSQGLPSRAAAGGAFEQRPSGVGSTTPLPPSLALSPPLMPRAGATRQLVEPAEGAPPPATAKGRRRAAVSSPAPAPALAPALSTLAGAAGAVGSADRWSSAPPRRRWTPWIAGVALALVAAAGGAFAWRWNGSSSAEATAAGSATPAEVDPAPAAAAPRAEAVPTTLAVEAAARTPARKAAEAPPAAAAETAERPAAVVVAAGAAANANHAVVLRINSTPPGAEVSDRLTGQILGETPFRGQYDRDGSALSLRVRKVGYKSKDLQVTLDQDQDLNVSLRKPTGDKTPVAGEDHRKL